MKNIYKMIMLEYYSINSKKDKNGKLIPEYGEVSTNDVKKMDGYDLPVHRSLW